MKSPQTFLYLTRDDVAAVDIGAAAARQAVIDSFRGFSQGISHSLPKQALTVGPGHGFQAMVAASGVQNVATVKWVGITALDHGDAIPRIQALICINDLATGALLAVMDGDLITLIRTAAMSAAAAVFLAPREPRTLGFIGCGAQAFAHLTAFQASYPDLEQVFTYSRSKASADALANQAGRAAGAMLSAEAVVRQSDIVITTVPAAADLVAFLDPDWLKPDAFVSAVDVGRSWIAEKLDLFDIIATDSMTQADGLASADGNISGRRYDFDLAGLAARDGGDPRRAGRILFSFKGFAIGDLAVATLVYEKARSLGLGTVLRR